MEVFGHLDQILDYSWSQLANAPNQRRHSWRTAVVANLVGQRVLQRTVVLRKAIASKRILRFYTDIRSTKIQPLPNNGSFSWLFYDPRRQIQLRLQTEASLIQGDDAAEIWERVNPHTLKDYASISAPGTVFDGENELLHPPNEKELFLRARENFVVVDCLAAEIEFLQLHRDGHRRARFTWEETKGQWDACWLVP